MLAKKQKTYKYGVGWWFKDNNRTIEHYDIILYDIILDSVYKPISLC